MNYTCRLRHVYRSIYPYIDPIGIAMKIYHERIHVILMMKMEQTSRQFVCLLKGRFKQPLFFMRTFEYTCIILWKHNPTPENPSNFQQKRGISHKHRILSQKTNHGKPGVHRNTPAPVYRKIAGEAPTRGGRGARVQGPATSQSRGMQLHKEWYIYVYMNGWFWR